MQPTTHNVVDFIKPIDFDQTHLKLRPSHTWPPCNGGITTFDDAISPIPIIDLTQIRSGSSTWWPESSSSSSLELRRACEEWGIFQITNHGIPMELLKEAEAETRRFFSLPLSQKLQVLRTKDQYTGYGLASISKFFSKLMWHEGFSIMGSPREYASKLWPHQYSSRFSDVMEEYQKAMNSLAEKLLCMILSSLGLSSDDMEWFNPDKTKSTDATQAAVLQLFSYPVCPDPDHAMGLAPHTDSSLFTMIYQCNNIGGLQVLHNSVWVPVKPIPHAITVNVGDLLHILTNGQFTSVLHRVVVNQSHHRYSLAYIYGPPWNEKIFPPAKVVGTNGQRLYRPVTWKDYLGVKALHFSRALEFLCLETSKSNDSKDFYV